MWTPLATLLTTAVCRRSSLGNLLVREPPKNSKVKWTRLPTAPSIPTQSQSFGYEQGPYGKLVRHEPATVGHTGKGSDTLGPGEYDPLRDLKRIHKTRAADFSKGKVPSGALPVLVALRAERGCIDTR